MPTNVCHAFSVEGLDAELLIEEFDGFEALSQLYRFEIAARCDVPIAFEEVIGASATLTMQVGPDDPVRFVHGVVSRIEQADTTVDWAGYRLTLMPKMFRLVHRTNSRIFQELSVPEVIDRVFTDAGFADGTDFTFYLRNTYEAREYCVQYRESDWDFVCRLMEDEGIAFFFDQGASHAILVMIDSTSAYPDIPGTATLRWRPPQDALGAVEASDHVFRFTFAQELRSNQVTLRDYDFQRPDLLLEASAQGSSAAALEVYDYPGEYWTPEVGRQRATVRLEELQASAALGEGDSSAVELLPGFAFTLKDHPRETFNTRYLLTRVEHHGQVPGVFLDVGADVKMQRTPYRNRFEVILSDVLFRPPRVTPRPAIHGAQTAVVVGPSSEQIHTDEHGRIKVQFFWDRLGKEDEHSSCWVRVSQMWAGSAFGAVFIPRIGHEVVITFLEGNPDRPLVVGSVYHGSNITPYPLPDEKTKSTVRSHTVDDSQGFNELCFEDKPGSEEIYQHAQKDLMIRTENDKTQFVGHDESVVVQNDREKRIDHDQYERVGNDDVQEVIHDRSVKIHNDSRLHVGGNRAVDIDGNDTERVVGNHTCTIDKNREENVGGTYQGKFSETHTLDVAKDAKHDYGKKLAVTVGGDWSQVVKGSTTLKVTGDLDVAAANAKQTVDADYVIDAGNTVNIKCGSSQVTINRDGSIEIAGKRLSISCTGDVQVSGANVDVTAQGSAKLEASGSVTISGDASVEISSSATVSVSGSMVNLG